MMKPITFMILLSFTFTLTTMVTRQQHVLPTLLCLESLMLFLIIFTMLSMNNQLMEMSPLMIMLLVMSVSSASIGLTLLVTLSRKEGNDSTMGYSVNLC